MLKPESLVLDVVLRRRARSWQNAADNLKYSIYDREALAELAVSAVFQTNL
jgi:hypothetical protein